MVNVHASGGPAMMRAAREALGETATKVPLLIAVTVLTSMDEAELAAVGVSNPIDQQVSHLTGIVNECGLDGVVCSAHEASAIKTRFSKLVTVTPGIRMSEDSGDDQRRVMTPERAMQSGSNYLVIGRSVTGAKDPVEQLRTIQQTISAVS